MDIAKQFQSFEPHSKLEYRPLSFDRTKIDTKILSSLRCVLCMCLSIYNKSCFLNLLELKSTARLLISSSELHDCRIVMHYRPQTSTCITTQFWQNSDSNTCRINRLPPWRFEVSEMVWTNLSMSCPLIRPLSQIIDLCFDSKWNRDRKERQKSPLDPVGVDPQGPLLK